MFSFKSAWHWTILAVLTGSVPSVNSQEAEAPPPAPPVAAPNPLSPVVEGAPAAAPANGEVLTPYEKLLERLEITENRLRLLERDEGVANALAVEPEKRLGHEVPKILLVHDPEVAVAREQIAAEAARMELPPEVLDPLGKARVEGRKEKKWYEKFSLRGYTQFRDNETLYQVNADVPNTPAVMSPNDGSVGPNRNFFIRRARIILQGAITDHIYMYLQEDFASSVSGATNGVNHYPQIRDWYFDIFFDTTQIHRVRVGQSKVPYGWENLQSSSNRIPLDRDDAINTPVKNERDLGAFYYWTPIYAQKLFRYVLAQNLKGSGNYGVFGLGVYNGQGGSFAEQNDNVHAVSRLTIPYQFDNGQIVEVGVQGYTGKYSVFGTAIRPLGLGAATITPAGTLSSTIVNRAGIRDERVAGTIIVYPQPIGFQCEWSVGSGPGLSPDQRTVEERALYGGYVMALAKIDTDHCGLLYPFVRWQYYKGGFKAEPNAPYGTVDEFEAGVEWQISPALEIVAQYTYTDRVNTQAATQAGFESYRNWEGSLLRMQLQVNY